MRYKEDNDNRYRVNFMRATEELMDALTVESFISYLEENAEFEDYTVEYIDKKCVNCKAYDLKEADSNLHKEFLVTEDGRVFYWRTLLDKIELVDDEIPEGMVEGLQEGDTYRNFNAIWVVDKIYTVDDPTLWYELRIKSHVIKKSHASMNAQSVIGQGVSTFTDDGSTNMAVVTGATSGLGNGSGIDPNAGVDGKCSVSYRGEENLWGNIWTWLDAINIYNDKASGVYNAFVKPYGECKDDTTADGYKALDFNIATGEGYISGFGYDEDHPDLFLCAEHNGASNLPVGDYYWNNNDGFRVAGLGGRWGNGARCGAWCLLLNDASSDRYRHVGGRLLYVPQTKISA